MRTKVLLLCVSSTLFALCLQALFFQSSASSLMYEQEREASQRSLQSMQSELYLWIKTYENDLIKIYNRNDLVRDLDAESAGTLPRDELRAKYRRVAYDMALSVFDSSQGVNAIYVYDLSDAPVSSYRSASTPLSNYPEDILQDRRAYNADIVSAYVRSDSRVMLVSSYYNDSRKRDVLRFALKIYANDVLRKIGYIVCDVDVSSFRRIIEKYVFSARQIVWLQPSGDRPTLRYGEPAGRQAAYFEEATGAIRAGSWSEGSAASIRDSVLFGIPQEKYDLTAYSLTPQYLLESSQRTLARNLLLIILLVVAMAMVGAVIIALSLTGPLTRMSRQLKRIRDGETSLRLTGLGADETGELGRAVNGMLDRIQILIAEEYQAELLKRQAEYKALQAQVNPHFLYNSLDTMSALATARGCPEVGTLCRALSNIFRYSIDMKEDLSTVRNEIVNVKNYMYVMNARMGGGVELDIRIDGDILGEKVPRLSLQPLVENALIHGLKDKRGEKTLAIEGGAKEGGILLSVVDNGVGMDGREIDRALAGGSAEVLGRDSLIGLCNINARVKLLFGEGYGVSVESGRGRGCRVSIFVPRTASVADEEA
jgi:sensor histidine kinase YesM